MASMNDLTVAGSSQGTSLPPHALTSRPNALALAKALRRRWLLASSAGLICTGFAAIAAWILLPNPKYTARTEMLVPQDDRFLLPTSEPRRDLVSHQKTQVALVKSRWVLDAALKPQRRPDGSEFKLSNRSMLSELSEPVEEWLEKHLQAEFLNATEILRISISGDRPAEQVALVNQVREAYQREVLDREFN